MSDRCGRFRRSLAVLKEAGPELTDQDRSLLQDALIQAVRIADRIEDWDHKPIEAAEAAELAKQVARQRDNLSAMLGRLRRQIGEDRS